MLPVICAQKPKRPKKTPSDLKKFASVDNCWSTCVANMVKLWLMSLNMVPKLLRDLPICRVSNSEQANSKLNVKALLSN